MKRGIADQYIAEILERKTPYLRTINNTMLRITEGVYPTGKIGMLFVKALELPEVNLNSDNTVLDYGTGTGFLAITASKRGAKVVAIDKNSQAIECAKFNAELNADIDCIDFRVSDGLSAIDHNETFDVILAGIPWEDAAPRTLLEMAFYDKDFAMRRDLAKRAKHLLNKRGIILISFSQKIQNINPVEEIFSGYFTRILVEDIINNEPHYIIGIMVEV